MAPLQADSSMPRRKFIAFYILPSRVSLLRDAARTGFDVFVAAARLFSRRRRFLFICHAA